MLALALSGDGERLYAAGARTCVVSWDANTGERLGTAFQGRMVRKAIPGAADAESDDEAPRAPKLCGETSRAARLEEEARLAEEAAAAEALLASRRAKGTPENVIRAWRRRRTHPRASSCSPARATARRGGGSPSG